MTRGEIYWCDLNRGAIGSEQRGKRPVLVLQNDLANQFAPTVTVAPITSRTHKNCLCPEHIYICSFDLTYPSIVLLEQMRTVDKQRISERIGKLSALNMQRVEAGLRYFLSLSQKEKAGDEWL